MNEAHWISEHHTWGHQTLRLEPGVLRCTCGAVYEPPCEWCGWPDNIHDAACERPEVAARDAHVNDGLTAAERAERDFGYE
jgi:hypothetical protein